MDEPRIRRAVLETLKSIAPELDVSGLKSDQPLRRQVDLDSMDWLNIIAGLHERLQVDIPRSHYGNIATLAGSLMAALIDSARQKGLTEMEGFVLAANHRMLKFVRQLGFSVQRDADDPRTVRVVRKL